MVSGMDGCLYRCRDFSSHVEPLSVQLSPCPVPNSSTRGRAASVAGFAGEGRASDRLDSVSKMPPDEASKGQWQSQVISERDSENGMDTLTLCVRLVQGPVHRAIGP